MLQKVLMLFFAVPALLLAGPVLSLDRNSHAFGRIPPDAPVHVRFRITNTGDDLLRVNRVEASCGCTSAVVGRPFLKPGESADLEVDFDPKKDKGPVQKYLTLHSNDPAHPAVELELRAEVVPAILASQDDTFFPEVLRSERPSQTVRLTSSSGGQVRILRTAGPIATFLRVETRAEGKDAMVVFTLDGAKLPPQARHGSETVHLSTDDPRQPEVELRVLWSAGRAIQPTPSRILLEAGRGATAPLVLRQARGRAFRILSCEAKPPLFRVEGLRAEAAARHELTVVLDAKAPAGQHAGILAFRTEDPDLPEFEVQVYGRVE